MKTPVVALLCLGVLLSACTLPDATGPVRVCVPDSAICYFEERK